MSPFEKSRFYRPKSETESALNGPGTDRRASFTRRFRLGLLHVSGQAPQHARDVPLAQLPQLNSTAFMQLWQKESSEYRARVKRRRGSS